MALAVFNTLTKKKEEFTPIDDKKVKMYVCGVTVYDDLHMGHARHIVVFDMIVRYLRYRGYAVTHVTNFTDVDDKIINRANELAVPPLELSGMYIGRYFEEIERLGVKRADEYPKASEFVPQIIDMIRKMENAGYAYRTGDGSVYFNMENVAEYGTLSGAKKEELLAGSRVDPDEMKRDPADFALWKGAKPGEISWPSPWGEGRPGWHIECSAMCMDLLGETIDIHGGGTDLIFPHHENEILQSRSVTGKPLANYWIHNGMLQVQEEKMSKSLKNFFTVRQVLENFTKEEIRFYFLNNHYRGPIAFSDVALSEAAASLRRLHNAYEEMRNAKDLQGTENAKAIVDKARMDFIGQMDDDFNSRGAFAVLFDLVRETNRLLSEGRLSPEGAADVVSFLEEVDGVFGVLPSSPAGKDVSEDIIQILVDVRQELRKRKLFDLADSIREKLAEKGVVLEDRTEGAKWKRA